MWLPLPRMPWEQRYSPSQRTWAPGPYLPFQDLYPLLVNLLTGLQSLCGLQLGFMKPLSLSCQDLLVLGSQLSEPLGVGLLQLSHLGLE